MPQCTPSYHNNKGEKNKVKKRFSKTKTSYDNSVLCVQKVKWKYVRLKKKSQIGSQTWDVFLKLNVYVTSTKHRWII
jgi:hypothetical protein